MDSMIPNGQKNTLAEYMTLSGADNCPQMLDKPLYDSWKSIMELYMQNREHGRMILESVKHDQLDWPSIEVDGVTRLKKYAELSASEKLQADCDLKATNIILQGLPTDVYALIDSGLAVPVFKEGYDPIDAINKMMSFLQQATIHDGRVTVQPVQGRQSSFAAGHMARQCIKPKRKRDATWFRDKVLLVEAQGFSKVLNEEELEFLADPWSVGRIQFTQTELHTMKLIKASELDGMILTMMDFCHSKTGTSQRDQSSNVRPIHTLFESLGRWTKDHPIANVIEDPSRYVSTRKKLQTDAMWCYFDAFLTFNQPNNSKQAMTKPSWIDACRKNSRIVKRHKLRNCLLMAPDTGMSLTAYADADHAGCQNTRRSTSGSAQFLGDKLVSWSFKKQKSTAISSTKAEYIALSGCYVNHSRAKHIDVRYHFIKEQVENGIVELYFVRTEYQLADIFTKPLPRERFNFLIEKLGMKSISWKCKNRLIEEEASKGGLVFLEFLEDFDWVLFRRVLPLLEGGYKAVKLGLLVEFSKHI
ncbi:hypothetical protein Tco_1093942 [Tanacetum coccineum]|uniref:Reverse transcriptase Ty1/copia-type domain-containing protein n=1 Tax=Tanacetum coccineum TaxID=301880 RepID=A0ABQ5IE57_9ASTR